MQITYTILICEFGIRNSIPLRPLRPLLLALFLGSVKKPVFIPGQQSFNIRLVFVNHKRAE